MPDSCAVLASATDRASIAINCLIWIVTCALVAGGIDHSLPFRKVPGVHERYAHLAAHRERYDLLFVGSSRFHHQIIPARFDSGVLKSGGPAVRSFNFGIDAMRPPESFYVIREILALQPPKLRWVVIELMNLKAAGDRTNALTLRRTYWHDWRHTRLAWRDIVRSEFSSFKEWRLFTDILAGRVAEHLAPRK